MFFLEDGSFVNANSLFAVHGEMTNMLAGRIKEG